MINNKEANNTSGQSLEDYFLAYQPEPQDIDGQMVSDFIRANFGSVNTPLHFRVHQGLFSELNLHTEVTDSLKNQYPKLVKLNKKKLNISICLSEKQQQWGFVPGFKIYS